MSDIEDRQQQIALLLREKKQVKTAHLSRRFGVSIETIRKDLLDLQGQGVLVRVHGGARISPAGRESAYDRRRLYNQRAKDLIALEAAAGFEGGSVIYLDYGTTTYALAAALQRLERRVTVVTNSLPIAGLLADSATIDTIVLGGMLRGNERSLFGPIAERAMDTLYMDVGFFGCAGLHHEAGLTNHHALEAALSQKAMTHCGSVVALADADKFGTIAVNRSSPLSAIDLLITDQAPPSDLAAALDAADVAVTVTKEDSDGVP